MAQATKDKKDSKKGKKKTSKKAAKPCCTCCSKHCPLSKPRCGKGRKLAAKLL
jgi:hypothetical protein